MTNKKETKLKQKTIRFFVVLLVTLSLFFTSIAMLSGCNFPTELENGRFRFANANILIDHLHFYDGTNQHQAQQHVVNWFEQSLQILRPQVDPAMLPMFDLMATVFTLSLIAEWRWVIGDAASLNSSNEGREMQIRNMHFYQSFRSWQGGINQWVLETPGSPFTLENGRIISQNTIFEQNSQFYTSTRAMSQDRIIIFNNTNLKYDIFGSLFYFGVTNTFGVRDFWVSSRLIFSRV